MKFKDWWGKKHSLPKNKTVFWRPSAVALLIKNKQIFLIKAKMHGLWELPGGGVELNESIFKALEREVYEETGYKISVIDKQPLYMEDNYFYAPDRDEYFRAIPLIFLVKLKGNKQQAKPLHHREVSEFGWFTLDKLPRPINPMVIKVIKRYKEYN